MRKGAKRRAHGGKRAISLLVIAGLVPSIPLKGAQRVLYRYARDKPGHDDQIIYPRRKNLTDNTTASIHEGRFMRRLDVRIEGGGCGRVPYAHPKPRRLSLYATGDHDRSSPAVDSNGHCTGGQAGEA